MRVEVVDYQIQEAFVESGQPSLRNNGAWLVTLGVLIVVIRIMMATLPIAMNKTPTQQSIKIRTLGL